MHGGGQRNADLADSWAFFLPSYLSYRIRYCTRRRDAAAAAARKLCQMGRSNFSPHLFSLPRIPSWQIYLFSSTALPCTNALPSINPLSSINPLPFYKSETYFWSLEDSFDCAPEFLSSNKTPPHRFRFSIPSVQVSWKRKLDIFILSRRRGWIVRYNVWSVSLQLLREHLPSARPVRRGSVPW